jgi:hypothetical protein
MQSKSTSYDAYLSSPHLSLKHSTYFDVYDQLLSPFIGKNITFVEIGILGGGSLFMWRNFFGPNARIIGIDLNPEAKKWEEHGFEIFIGSQSDPSFWEEFIKTIGSVDIVLDDGGHTYLQQIVTVESLLEHINDNGLLIVEDAHTSYTDGFGDRRASFINYVKIWIDKINSRFAQFPKTQKDRRVWSVEIFESIVAFKINRKASELPSQVTKNKPESNSTRDYRHADKAQIQSQIGAIQKILKNAFSLYRDE